MCEAALSSQLVPGPGILGPGIPGPAECGGSGGTPTVRAQESGLRCSVLGPELLGLGLFAPGHVAPRCRRAAAFPGAKHPPAAAADWEASRGAGSVK